ncbi:class I SAM-dependent methyltransferase [Yersinia rohdei]|uniref:class I SAM-dependent methyltransferase n=1 Tax=Yersinia rohdei TaxID=29485 RepID=UPI0030151F76
MMDKSILDMCCGSRMFWFDRADPRAVFVDIRSESYTLCDGRNLDIRPDIVADFRQLPFADNTFQIVVFDPPHLTHCGPEGWQGKKYGILSKSWKDDLTKGFAEAFRVLRAGGVLIFKWNEVHIPTRDIIKLSPVPPMFGHPSGKRANTNWVCFQKPGDDLITQLAVAEAKLEAAELELIKPLPIGELLHRLEGQTYGKWFSESEVKGLRERAEAAEARLLADDIWIKSSEAKPDPNRQRRVCVFTPHTAVDLRYRLVAANLFEKVCTDATHWHYVNDPVEGGE